MSDWELFAFRYAGDAEPGLSDAARVLGLSEEDVDPDYGVVKVEEGAERSLYVVMLRPGAVSKAEDSVARVDSQDPTVGRFSNPRQETLRRGHEPPSSE